MTAPGLAPPRRAAARALPPRPPSGTSGPSRASRPAGRRHPAFGRVFAWSIGGSVLIHLALLLLSPLFIELGVPAGDPNSEPLAVQTTREIQLLNPVASADAPDEPAQEPTTTESRPTARPDALRPEQDRPVATVRGERGSPPAPEAPGAQEVRSAREALRPGYRDRRLYVAPREADGLEQTAHQKYMEQLEARIAARRDSAAAGAPVTDWTFRDADGDRWGLSEDGLHLGPLRIPRELIPIPATGDRLKEEEARERQRQRDEIRRQEADRERRAEQDRAIEETRKRRDGEREG